MTKPAHHPKCECDFCFTDDVNAVMRRFLEQREKGKPPVDPDAEQLAGQVGELAGELRGCGVSIHDRRDGAALAEMVSQRVMVLTDQGIPAPAIAERLGISRARVYAVRAAARYRNSDSAAGTADAGEVGAS